MHLISVNALTIVISSAPNLQETITPSMLPVVMSVQELVGTVWTPVTGTLVSGTTIRLVVEYERGTNYIGKF